MRFEVSSAVRCCGDEGDWHIPVTVKESQHGIDTAKTVTPATQRNAVQRSTTQPGALWLHARLPLPPSLSVPPPPSTSSSLLSAHTISRISHHDERDRIASRAANSSPSDPPAEDLMQSPTPTYSSGPSSRSIPLVSPSPPCDASGPDFGRSSSGAHPALLRRVHEGVPVDVEGSDDEFGGDDYARSLRSSKLPSLESKDSLIPTETRSSLDGLSVLNPDSFLVPRTPADVPVTASSRLSEDRFTASRSSHATSAPDDDESDQPHLLQRRTDQPEDVSEASHQEDDDTVDDAQHAMRTTYTAPAIRSMNDVSSARRTAARSPSPSGSDADSFGSELSAVIVNLQERANPNTLAHRPQFVVPQKISSLSRPSTAQSAGTAQTSASSFSGFRRGTMPESGSSIQREASPSGYSSHRERPLERNHTAPQLQQQPQQRELDLRLAQTEVTTVNEPSTPTSIVSRSSTAQMTPTLGPPTTFVTPLLHVLQTPLNLSYKPGATSTSSINGVPPPPSSLGTRKFGDAARSASVSSSAGSLYGRNASLGGAGSTAGSGPSRSTSIDGSGSGSGSRGEPPRPTSSNANSGFAASGKSQSVDNLHASSSGSGSHLSFTRRQSGGPTQGRSAPPNPLDLRSPTRSVSARGSGSDSVENLHDGPHAAGGRQPYLRERNHTGSDGRGEHDTVPASPGASSARSSGSRFLSVGRKWAGYMHGNSSNESASSALQARSPVSTGGFNRGSMSARSDMGPETHTNLYLPHAGTSRPSTSGSTGQIDASSFPRPNALNGATWASGTRSPERSSFTTGWEKTSQRPSTVAPEMAPRTLTEDDIEYEEATHWGEPSSLFGIRRRLVASIPDLGVKASTFSRSRAKTMELPAMPQSSLLAEKDYRKMEERLEQREKDLSVEILAEQETATVTLVVFTEQREAKWITKGPASPNALPMDHLPSMNDPWGVRIDAKGIVARKKLKSNIELVSTRTILRCPECSAVRQTRMNVQCHLCRGVQAVEMVYVVLVTIRMANFTPLKLPAALITGQKQPHFHYYDGDPAMRGAALQERAADSALTAAKRVGQQHYASHGAKLLMVKARVDRRRVTSVAVLSTKSGKRRTFDLSDGHDGKVVETTPGKRPEDAPPVPPRTPDESSSLAAAASPYEHGANGRALGRKHSMPAVLKSGTSLFSRRGSTDDAATIGASEKGSTKSRRKFFG
ncbi:hypothetical protein OC842_005916 [Tilletia horrida]|uniref:Uncharacterized protein n=1 Tax=Tilletia horrida TaxID=155126 RepID=A0AAN6G9H0_9BASI|nr:hypothetical protein OC842_005916 [Tilletia horrida]